MVLGQLTSEDDEEVRRRIENLHRQWLRASSESERGQAKLDLDELLNELHGHAVQAVLQRRHQRANLSWVGLRWLSMLLYLAGISILVVLLINRSLEVFRDYREGYVIIKSNMEGEKLRLSAYTFLADEFVMLENVLKGSGASASYGSLPPDGQRREGRAYWVFGAAIEKFSQAIGGRFDDAGVFSTTGNGGQNYACREKKVGAGDGKGCENITAVDSSAAMVACGLVSQQKGWDYGKATPGVCRRP
jgi:hypothetical protein